MSRRRIIDPLAIPVVGHDGHLPALLPQRLTAAALRQRFAAPHAARAHIAGDAPGSERRLTAASVLVPLVQREAGLQVLLTQRTAHLREHAGQISFPGGRAEPGDADAVAAALRETEEEIGLPRANVEVVGALTPYVTVTDFVVTPVVALVRTPFTLRLDSFEVADAFEVPLQFLMTPAHHQRHELVLDGQRRQFLSMPWDHGARRYFIWGATAAMLRNLYVFLGD